MVNKTYKLSRRFPVATVVAGIDAHKYKVHVVVLASVIREYKPLGEQIFNTDSEGLQQMCGFLDNFRLDDIIMEKTGRYSNPVHDAIRGYNGWKHGPPRVQLVQPTTVKRFAGESHLDKVSALALARLGISGLLSISFIPSADAARLRDLTRGLDRLTSESSATINKIKDTLSGFGYTLPDLDLRSAWGIAFLKLLFTPGIDGNITRIYSLLERGHVKIHTLSKKALLDRKDNFIKYSKPRLSKHDARTLYALLAKLCMVEALKESKIAHVEDVINESPMLKERVKNLKAIDGISDWGAAVIACEADDMGRFPTCKKFLIYAGRAPPPDESGEYMAKRHMTKRCNHQLKKTFIQAGQTAFKIKRDSDIKQYASRQLAKHSRCKPIAAANTSAKIARIVYKVLHDQVTYEPFHQARQNMKNKPENKTSSTIIDYTFALKTLGYRIRRFRNFTHRMAEKLDQEHADKLFSHVKEIFDDPAWKIKKSQ